MINFDDILGITNKSDFDRLALEVFRFQFENNPVYRSFCDLLYVNPSDIKFHLQIPFLPIQFFKSHQVLSTEKPIQKTFLSSGSTGMQRSMHHLVDLNHYEQSFSATFEKFYGKPSGYIIFALLPSYLEQGDSSLVYMVEKLIEKAAPQSGFFLNDHDSLAESLRKGLNSNYRILLLGVSYALLDFAEKFPMDLKDCIVMETGGMKGRRKEMVRNELHDHLKKAFHNNHIHSEYGMTELLSQAYSKGDGLFNCPPWMKVLSRDPEDPFKIHNSKKTGGLNIIDLANINSCSFIATQDLGKVSDDGRFEVIGRFDQSDIRGCNLMSL